MFLKPANFKVVGYTENQTKLGDLIYNDNSGRI